MYAVSTNIGKTPLMPNFYREGREGDEYVLRNYKGEETRLPAIEE